MENAKQPEAFNTAENNRGGESRLNPPAYGVTSIFSNTQEFKVDGFRSKMIKFLDSTGLLIFMLIVTIYALFSDDIRVSSYSKDDDDVFFGLSCCAMIFFGLEMILCFIFKEDYRWSFYFWLDLIATLSIIPDIGWAWDSITGDQGSNSSSNVNQIQSAGKSSRAGTRAARVIKIVRLVRLMRIAKIYKHAKNAASKKGADQVSDNNNLAIPKESRVGRILSDLLTKRVIVLVMVILILIPLFDLEFFKTTVTSWEYGLQAINSYEDDVNNYEIDQDFRDYYIDYFDDMSRPVIYIAFDKNSEWEKSNSIKIDDLREIEKYYAHFGTESVAIFDIRTDTRLDAKLNICKTIFVCIVLVSAAVFFTKDANDYAIIPIEKMIMKVKKMAENPLKIAEERVIDIYDIMEEKGTKNWYDCCKKKKINDYETQVLENTFVKIGVLLALGFGEAGAQIISSNIRSSGDVDPIIKGQKIAGIFGFCDIRNFTDATEELQEGVMLFVNELAKIVHSTVDHFLGAANKNIGDAFLIVWKMDSEQVEEFSDPIKFKAGSKECTYMADLALASFLKIMVKVNKDPTILKYRSNPKLTKRMPGYQVKFGFGLHLGWAIEGAIGSIYKIDASYLSHHVNMSMNLEGLTKAYGVPLLMTDTVYNNLSDTGKTYCRHIDRVSLKGGRETYSLYTSDADFSLLMPGRVKDYDKIKTKKKRNHLKFQLDQNLQPPDEIISESKEIEAIKKPFPSEFFEVFDKGMQFYLAGKWNEAKDLFENVLKIRNSDGPAKALIGFMEESNFVPPDDWRGIRALY